MGGLAVVPDMDKPTTIMVDNTAAIALSHNAAVNRRNKHIHVRYHFTRDAIHDGLVRLQYCPRMRWSQTCSRSPLVESSYRSSLPPP